MNVLVMDTTEPKAPTDDVPTVCTDLTKAHSDDSQPAVSVADLEQGEDIDAWDDEGSTALITAVKGCGALSTVQLLIAAGADPNVPDKDGHTALHYAVECESMHLVVYLVDHGANKYAMSPDGRTPVHMATALEYDMLLECVLKGSQSELYLNHDHITQAPKEVSWAEKRRRERDGGYCVTM